ncbi:TetR family transcriptional regulator [Paraburkholderia monticola]|uniref:TetR family transcriptional regulator n=2 Tax=Paraburkholderia monticola TaxID=1399968 RepID=A0A149PEP7_9BURK|nr:TetR family transcriptional regulator [Paraburkholderia monticola]
MPLAPRKSPRQARSVALVDALMQAARQILDEEGREALTVLHLADVSGVASSSIFEYYPTMDALVAAIFDAFRADVYATLRARIAALPAQASLLDGILLIVRAGLGIYAERIRLDPDVCLRMTRYDELVRLDFVKSEEITHALVVPALFVRFADEISEDDVEQVQFLVVQTLIALARAMLLVRPAYLAEPDTPVLIARMIHALLVPR